MSVKNGRQFLSIPGPTTVPDEVLAAMHRPAVDIRKGELVEVTAGIKKDLRMITKTQGYPFIYIANGHGAWEGALTNVLNRDDKVLVLESGFFAVGWGQAGATFGLDVEILPGSYQKAVDPAALEARLKADTSGDIKAVLTVQIDTASSVVNDIPAIRRAIDNAGHDALLMVDTIASLGTMDYRMDEWGVDVTVAACQKGLMMSPGVSFVIANEKAMERHQNANLRTAYWDWTSRQGAEHYRNYSGTPPVHLLFGLQKAFEMINEEGLDAIFLRHKLLAEATRAAVGKWSEKGEFTFNITNPAERSNSVTTVLVTHPENLEAIHDYCIDKCNVVVGVGIAGLSGKALRIAHMGHINAPMLLGTLSSLEMSFKALGIPHGTGGVQAAIDHLAANVPR
ncbi:aminotransferase class V-fold PLP-dependent enzyme [Sneathiella chungangensis]|uniref:Aminotransferase class V-fold PLP-dependent enzyme n=1 Tax=Sneathiella chungangensis TaxID=1418234 RepID=A0A845MDY7_9PROT|nr:aminotransferase class V-fold PLP-dependent enzyme [Sneathiella chungangensis]MZR21881.1 aminotransferase class V-fold PLP-dependent enzyme [Sneathiella chungangensis]